MDDILLTGFGCVTAAGRGSAPLLAGLRAAACWRSGGAPWPAALVADAHAPWPAGGAWADLRKYAGRGARLAVAAARDALASATAERPLHGERTAVVVAVEPELEWAELAALLGAPDPRPPARRIYEDLGDFHVLRSIPSGAVQLVALCGPFEGGATAVARPCAGGLTALALAARLLHAGEADAALVAGGDALPPPHVLAAIDAATPLAREPSAAPFGASADGTFLGEGAAALLLERAPAARARGARPSARLAACETRRAGTLAASIDAALAAALARAPRPGAVWAHGSGVPTADRAEAAAIAAHTDAPVTADKGALGNLFSASALLDLGLAATCLAQGWLPAVALLGAVAPACARLPLVRGAARPLDAAAALVLAQSDPGPGDAGAAVLVRPDPW